MVANYIILSVYSESAEVQYLYFMPVFIKKLILGFSGVKDLKIYHPEREANI